MAVSQFSPLRGNECRPPRAAAASALQFPPLCNDLRARLLKFSLAPAQLPRAAGALTLQIVNRKS